MEASYYVEIIGWFTLCLHGGIRRLNRTFPGLQRASLPCRYKPNQEHASCLKGLSHGSAVKAAHQNGRSAAEEAMATGQVVVTVIGDD